MSQTPVDVFASDNTENSCSIFNNVVIVRVITLSILIYSSLLSNNKKNCFVFGSFIDSNRRNEVATQ